MPSTVSRAAFLVLFCLPWLPAAVQAQVPACPSRVPIRSLQDPFGPYGGCAPGSAPWEYDTGGDNDRFPERPRYQQGGGQQTGGPARNLIPGDRFHIVPR
jgi:hypothetical protein